MAVHTADPKPTVLDQAIRAYLNSNHNQPIRYRPVVGAVVNTPDCRGRIARYVLVEAHPDNTITVSPVRLGLRHLGIVRLAREPMNISNPADGHLLPLYVAMALDDLGRASA